MSRWSSARDRWKRVGHPAPFRLMQESLFLDGKILADFAAYLQREQKPLLVARLWLLAVARFGLELSDGDVEAAGKLASELEGPWDLYLKAPEGFCRYGDVQARELPRAATTQLLQSTSTAVITRQNSQGSVPEKPVVSGGRIVDQDNLMYEFAVSAMLGIRVAVSCQSMVDDAGLPTMEAGSAEDVDAVWRACFPNLELLDCLMNSCIAYEVPPEGTAYSPPTKQLTGGRLADAYVIEDYCPQLFAQVRRLSGISNDQFFHSICRPDVELVEFRTNSKSGEFFFFSHDGRFLLKTITRREAEVLIRMLPDMIARFEGTPHSLLCRYLGLYRIRQSAEEFDLLFSVMASVTQNSHPVHLAYDLKGSTKGRHSSAEEQVGKDLNFRREFGGLFLSRQLAEQLVRTHSEDLEILRRHGVLDYSVLLHIFDSKASPMRTRRLLFRQNHQGVRCNSGNVVRLATQSDSNWVASVASQRSMSSAGARFEDQDAQGEDESVPTWKPDKGVWSQDGRYLYTVGIIDLLIPYYWKKRIEAAGYEVMYCGSTAEASAVAPDAYADRQIEMMERICLAAARGPSDNAPEGNGDEVVPSASWACPCFRTASGYPPQRSDGETSDGDSSEATGSSAV